MDLIETLSGRRAVAALSAHDDAARITFCTVDKPFRLSQMCGVLTLNDCNILFAHAFTRTDGKVVDVFHVEDFSGTATIDETRRQSIEKDLNAVLRGRLDLNTAVDEHLKRWRRRKDHAIPVPPRVQFENDLSPDVTIVDIYAMDEPGLLFKITRALAEEGLAIHRARISTEGNRVIDSFDIQDRKGQKINAAAKLTRIRHALQDMLS
jgi:[protein-PII] uridylyltransferase